MKLLSSCTMLIALLLISPAGGADDSDRIVAFVPTAGEPTLQDIQRAVSRFEAWDDQSQEQRLMRVIYWTPADREPQPEYRARLTRVMKHIQNFYATQMQANGFGPRSINLELDAEGMLKLRVAKGSREANTYTETNFRDGREIRSDCAKVLAEGGIDADQETIVIFCNLANWDPDKRTMSHNSPYYASGDHSRGTAWQVDSALLDSDLLSVKDQFLRDRQYGRISVGRYNSIFVGGVCHELGHALSLPHCKQAAPLRSARGTALMGSGNRTYGEELREEGLGSFLTVGHAIRLAAHPQFSGCTKQMRARFEASIKGWEYQVQDEGVRIRATVEGNLPILGVVAYGDPDGQSDYDAEIAAAVPQEDGSFEMILPHPQHKKDCKAELRFVVVACNGAAAKRRLSFDATVGADGKLEVAHLNADS